MCNVCDYFETKTDNYECVRAVAEEKEVPFKSQDVFDDELTPSKAVEFVSQCGFPHSVVFRWRPHVDSERYITDIEQTLKMMRDDLNHEFSRWTIFDSLYFTIIGFTEEKDASLLALLRGDEHI